MFNLFKNARQLASSVFCWSDARHLTDSLRSAHFASSTAHVGTLSSEPTAQDQQSWRRARQLLLVLCEPTISCRAPNQQKTLDASWPAFLKRLNTFNLFKNAGQLFLLVGSSTAYVQRISMRASAPPALAARWPALLVSCECSIKRH